MHYQKHKKELRFVLLIPLINALATLTVNYFEPGNLNPGTLRAAIIGFFLIWFIGKRLEIKGLIKTTFVFLIYLLLLVLLSSNPFLSFYTYIKILIALMMLPIGIYYFNNFNELISLNKVFIIVIAFYVINLIISNYYQLGSSDYLDDTVFFGSGKVNIAKNVSLLLITAPFFFIYGKPNNKILYFLSVLVAFMGIVLVFLAVKRSGILSLIVGFAIYFLFSPHLGQKIKQLVVVFFLIIITSSVYIEPLLLRFEAREQRFDFSNPEFKEGEGRVREYEMVINEFKNRNIFSFLFGAELFNDREYYNTRRMLHTDYMIWLSGAGVVGFIWFYYLIFSVFRKINKYTLFLKSKKFRSLRAVGFALIIASLIISIAGSIYTVEILSNLFLYIGAIIGVSKNAIIEEFNNNGISHNIPQKNHTSWRHIVKGNI